MSELTSAIVRSPDGRFVKGFSGNCRGRPKTNPNVRKLARANTEAAILTLTQLSQDNNISENVRFLAGAFILQTGWRTNLLGHFLKGSNMTVWQYLNTPNSKLHRKKDASEAEPEANSVEISDTVKKILEIRKLAAMETEKRLRRKCKHVKSS